ncbi:UDP-2,3-diacylglucosamine hydrolase [Bacteroidia bacterium]|nr:UDP-2,3-diacylglucosamine hydrolase [Bacteroidia bacterium]
MENENARRDRVACTSFDSTHRIYFVSDLHLGAPSLDNNAERERKVVKWLDEIRPTCSVLFLLGDIYDFWFEYKYVVPKGGIRLLGKICEFTDSGIEVHFFTGNHDFGAFGYFQKECGIIVHTHEEEFTFNGKTFYIGHGDGINPKDRGYNFVKNFYLNHFLQRSFRFLIHPDRSIGFARRWSSHSRLNYRKDTDCYRGTENEYIELFCRKVLKTKQYDYFVFGHRHLPLKIQLTGNSLNGPNGPNSPDGPNSYYINTGDWITHYSYAVFDGVSCTVLEYCL